MSAASHLRVSGEILRPANLDSANGQRQECPLVTTVVTLFLSCGENNVYVARDHTKICTGGTGADASERRGSSWVTYDALGASSVRVDFGARAG